MSENELLYDVLECVPQYVAPRDIFHDYNSIIRRLEPPPTSRSPFHTIVYPRPRSPACISLRPNNPGSASFPCSGSPARPLMTSFIAPQHLSPPSTTSAPTIPKVPHPPRPEPAPTYPKRRRYFEGGDQPAGGASNASDPEHKEDGHSDNDDDDDEYIEDSSFTPSEPASRFRPSRSRKTKVKAARRKKGETSPDAIALFSSRNTFQWLRAALSRNPTPNLQHSPCLFCRTNQHSMGRHVRSIHRFQISETIYLARRDSMDVSLPKIDQLLILFLLIFDLQDPTSEECAEIVELRTAYPKWPSSATSAELNGFNLGTYRSLWNRIITEFAEKWYMQNTCSCGKRYTRRESAERHVRRAGAGHRVLGDDASDTSSAVASDEDQPYIAEQSNPRPTKRHKK
jgi:hypothetical protein